MAGLAALGLAPEAEAATAPTSPYDAFTVDAVGSSFLAGAGSAFAFDNSTGGTVTFSPFGTGGAILSGGSGGETWTADLTPPTGGAFVSGTTYDTTRVADATHAGLDLSVASRGCGSSTGSLTVESVTIDANSSQITSLAASYSATCDTDGVAVAGELRWHSPVTYIAATSNHTSFAFGNQDVNASGTAQTVTFTGAGSANTVLGKAIVSGSTGFSISGDTCSNTTLAYGQTCTVTVTPHPTAPGSVSGALAIPDNSTAGKRTVALSMNAIVGAAGTFYPLAPTRILDTRSGLGAPKAALGAGGVISLQVNGRGGVPATGVSAVVLNVTVTGPTATSFLTVWPNGATQPTASSLNFPTGWTGANSVTVATGSGGKVNIYNARGSVQVIADVTGFYASDDTVLPSLGVGNQLQPVFPQRILDTRDPAFGGALPSGWFVVQAVDFGAAVNSTIQALAVNITAVSPTGYGYLTAWNGNGSPPNTSVLDVTPGVNVPNMAIVPVGSCDIDPSCAGLPAIGVYNGSSGSTHVLIDLVGYYSNDSSSDGLRFHSITPTRIVDSRSGQGTPSALGPQSTATVTTPAAIGDENTAALALNVTAVSPTANTFLTVWPAGVTQPSVSNLNPMKGQTVPNAVITLIDSTGAFNIYNSAGTVNVVVDVDGYFDLYQFTPDNQPRPQVKTPKLRTVKPGPGKYGQP